MDFDFTTEGITPNSSTILTVGSTGALDLPSGTTAQRPGSASAGGIRWNTSLTTPAIEYYNGTSWTILSTGGSVTSVALSMPSIFSVTGSPVTTTGTLTASLNTQANNAVLAGPSTGGPSVPTFRTLGLAQNDLNDVVITSATNGQILSYNSSNYWVNTTVGTASYSVNVGPSGTVAWVSAGSGYYTATVTHNLGTQNVVVSLADISNNQIVQPDLIVITSSSVVTIRVFGNTKTLRVTVLANGASIAAGASTPSSVIVQNSGVPLSGTYTALNLTGIFSATGASGTATITNAPFTGDATSSGTALTLATVNGTVGTFGSTSAIPVVTVNAKGLVTNVTTVAVTPSIIRTLSYYATSLDSPNNADWTINALAPTVADPTNGGINVRQFSNTTEQGVGLTLTIPTGATNIIFTYRGRSASATAGTLQMRLYNRVLASATPAAVGTWSAATNLTSVSSPANVFYQTFTQTSTLASLSLTAGNLYQFEFTRNVGVAGNLAFNWLMVELAISFT